MIDEKKLIEELFCTMPREYGFEPIQWFRQLIDSQPKIGEWIPCSERFPKKNDSYLVTWEMRATKQCFTGSSRFTNGKWETMLGTCEVIAWQPKPEPWKGE